MDKKLKNIVLVLLVVLAAYFFYVWYQAPIKTEIKDVFWNGPTGGILFSKATVNTFRDGSIIAEIGTGAITPGTNSVFTQLKWDETSKQWLPIYN